MRRPTVAGVVLVAALVLPATTFAQRFDTTRERTSTEQLFADNYGDETFGVRFERWVFSDGHVVVNGQFDFYALGVSAMCPLAEDAITVDPNKGTARVHATVTSDTCWGSAGFGTLTIDLAWVPDGAYHSSGHTNAQVSYNGNAPGMGQAKSDYWTAVMTGQLSIDGAPAIAVPTGWGGTYVSRDTDISRF